MNKVPKIEEVRETKLQRSRENNNRYLKKNPWSKYLDRAKCRCKRKNYIKRGIKCFLSMDDIKFLWFRDKAWELQRPSLDRIDTTNSYILNNCRFIELQENIRRHSAVSVSQYSLEGQFIKKFDTLYQAAISMGKKKDGITNIARVAFGRENGKYPARTAYGFIWKINSQQALSNKVARDERLDVAVAQAVLKWWEEERNFCTKEPEMVTLAKQALDKIKGEK